MGDIWAFLLQTCTASGVAVLLLIVKAMYIKKTDAPLPTFKSDGNTKLALAICTAGVLLFGVCSFFYDWIEMAA